MKSSISFSWLFNTSMSSILLLDLDSFCMNLIEWMFIYCIYVSKVQLFWEGHKNLRNRPYGFEIYLVNVKTIRTIAQIFVAFSEKMNFSKAKNMR